MIARIQAKIQKKTSVVYRKKTSKTTHKSTDRTLMLFNAPHQGKGGLQKHTEKECCAQHSSQLNCSLSRNQLAALQVIVKDLQTFSGNPEEWSNFFSTYGSTTRMWGYTNDETMIRLRNCLRRDAFAAVKSLLFYRSTMNKCSETVFWATAFHFLRDKIIAMPRLSQIQSIDFALTVQNFETTVDECGQREFMRDMSLLGELIWKLSASMKLKWPSCRITQESRSTSKRIKRDARQDTTNTYSSYNKLKGIKFN